MDNKGRMRRSRQRKNMDSAAGVVLPPADEEGRFYWLRELAARDLRSDEAAAERARQEMLAFIWPVQRLEPVRIIAAPTDLWFLNGAEGLKAARYIQMLLSMAMEQLRTTRKIPL